jgi:hypothetical protein
MVWCGFTFLLHSLIVSPRGVVFGHFQGIAGSFVSLLEMELSRQAVLRGGSSAALVFSSLIAFHFRQRLPVAIRIVLLGCFFVIVTVLCGMNLQVMRANIKQPPQWDFRVFWMYGQLTVGKANVYDPRQYDRFKDAFQPSKEFIEAVLNVGATYPPPTMLLFLPLGFWQIRAAYLFWYGVQAACLIGSLQLLRKLFLDGSGIWGLALAAILIFSLRATWSTIGFGQTNFLALLFALLYWRDRQRPHSGVWLALGMVVKLYFVIVLLHPTIRRQWRALAWTAIGSFILAMASLAMLGPVTFFSYFTMHPASRLPAWVYTERINQSLAAVVLRISGQGMGNVSSLTQPVFVVAALLLTAVTGYIVHRARHDSEWSLALILVLALLLYPGTLAHYTVILLIPLLLIWNDRDNMWAGAWGTAGLISLIYGLIGLFQGNSTFAAILMVWMVLAARTLQRIRQIETKTVLSGSRVPNGA